jgi:hypothetical protein
MQIMQQARADLIEYLHSRLRGWRPFTLEQKHRLVRRGRRAEHRARGPRPAQAGSHLFVPRVEQLHAE